MGFSGMIKIMSPLLLYILTVLVITAAKTYRVVNKSEYENLSLLSKYKY